ncbi:MAG: methionine--tRNA ligase [Treponema sp.]|nr:methionine--tRNA ligase [Treponema sp.]
MTKRRLITAALPYANNIPHLGNLVQVLSADAFARFCRLREYETLYICGTDEYGTATETRAAEDGISPQELCDHYHEVHDSIYRWFQISFDKFGRTSTLVQTQVTQDIFNRLDKAGFISEHEVTQLHCTKCQRFLADRFVRGVCPHCDYADARGDQCETCGKLLDPTDLKDPRCHVCGSTPIPQSTKHLYIDLPKIKDKLEAWIKVASEKGFWAHNAVQMTQAWIRDGLRERAITRDLKWGIPVPKPGYENKVFYVWFDAPIGYISITGCLGEEIEKGWMGLHLLPSQVRKFSEWRKFVAHWWESPDDVELFQFIGKDNIPFHTVVFPSSLLGSGGKWTMLHHMSSTEYLNYESGKFSKSRGVGVFGSDVMDTGIPPDVWRFYIFYNRPEKADVMFTWKDFQEKVNGELIGNMGNLVNRTLSFITRYYDGEIPQGTSNPNLWEKVRTFQKSVTEKLERAELRDAFREIFALSSYANKYFQDAEPWRLRTEDPERAAQVIRDLAHIVRDLAIMIDPYMPQTSTRILMFFGLKLRETLKWHGLGRAAGLFPIKKIESTVLFSRLEDDEINRLRERFSGNLKDRNQKEDDTVNTTIPAEKQAPTKFEDILDLRVAKIEKVERHPNADKLYVIDLEVGEGTSGTREERTIVSGLVSFYTEEQLVGKRIVVAYNLKPAKLRGVQSRGMLLAAGDNGGTAPDGSPAERCEVLDAGDAPTGTRLLPEGLSPDGVSLPEIDIDTFFACPIAVIDFAVQSDGRNLCLNGKPVRTSIIQEGKVN